MSRFHEEVPPELRDIDAELRARRSNWSPLEVDRVKRRAMTGGRRTRPRALAQLARGVMVLAVSASVGVGGLAIAHTFTPAPGQGCGAFHHTHYKLENKLTGETSVKCKPNKGKHTTHHDGGIPDNHHNCRETPGCFVAGTSRSSLR